MKIEQTYQDWTVTRHKLRFVISSNAIFRPDTVAALAARVDE